MSQNQHQSGSSNCNIPVSEVYWALVAKADKKFSKIRDLPYYQRTRLWVARTAAMLLSPAISLPLPAVELNRPQSGSLFISSFLTAPLQSLVLLLGPNGSDIEKVW